MLPQRERPRRAKFVPNTVKCEDPLAPPINLPPPPPLPEIEIPPPPDLHIPENDYVSRKHICAWASKWQKQGFEFVELEENPRNKEEILVQFRCVACREAGDTESPFFEGVMSNSVANVGEELFRHFEGDKSAPVNERKPFCKHYMKFLPNDLVFDDDDEETASEEEWAPPSLHVQRTIEATDKHEELMFEEEHKQTTEYNPPRCGNVNITSRKRRHSSDTEEEEKKRTKRKKAFEPEARHFIRRTVFEALKREFARQSFQFQILQEKEENGIDLVAGRIWCQACAELGRGRYKEKGDIPEGIMTTPAARDTLANHCFPNPGQVKKLWVCLKHQEALKEWVIRKQMHRSKNLPRTHFLQTEELHKLQTKFGKRGLKFDILHRRSDIDGSPLACVLIRCEACIWMQGHCQDFGHEDGVISTENIGKLVKRHCKEKNLFHHQAWDHWRTIQKLKVAQHSEYTRMVRKHKRNFNKPPPALPEPEPEAEASTVETFSLRLNRNQMEKLRRVNFVEDLTAEFPDLTVEVKDTTRTLVLKAPKKTLMIAQRRLRNP